MSKSEQNRIEHEIMIGLVAPMGTDREKFTRQIKKKFERIGYRVETIDVIEFFGKEVKQNVDKIKKELREVINKIRKEFKEISDELEKFKKG